MGKKGVRPPNAPRGRRKGSQNRTTRAAKELLTACFEEIGGLPAFATWARKNRGAFYGLWVKLLPAEAPKSGAPLVNISLNATSPLSPEAAYALIVQNPEADIESIQARTRLIEAPVNAGANPTCDPE